jgi:hypothetical protein
MLPDEESYEGFDERSCHYPSLNAIRLFRSFIAFDLMALVANAAASDELVTLARRCSRQKVYGVPSIEFEPSHHDAVRGDNRGGMDPASLLFLPGFFFGCLSGTTLRSCTRVLCIYILLAPEGVESPQPVST